MASGIQEVKDVHFKSPIDGTDRIAGLGVAWCDGGQTADNGKLAYYWMYAYRDELTPEIMSFLNEELDRVAKKMNCEILCRPSIDQGKDIDKMIATIDSETGHYPGPGWQMPPWYTGFGPMNARLEAIHNASIGE